MELVYIHNILFIQLASLNPLGTSQLQMNEKSFTTFSDGVLTIYPLSVLTHLIVKTTL